MSTPAAQEGPAGAGGPRRRRRPPKPVEVVSVSRVSPRMVSVLVAGDGLEGFAEAAPTSHLKVFLPVSGQREPNLPDFTPDGPVYPGDGPPPVVRTYTPRRYDPAAGTLEIQFLLHGEGPAAAWARQAGPGDKLGVAGPGGRFSLEPDTSDWWIAGDESAIPAIATLLEALPSSAAAEVHIEAGDAGGEVALASPARVAVAWHVRKDGDGFGTGLTAAAREAAFPDGARVWVGCEAGAMRGIRRYLAGERGIPAGRLVTRGYWRVGEQNHPDHDYGED